MGKDVIIHCICYKRLKERGQLLVKKETGSLIGLEFTPSARLAGQ